MPKRSSSDTDQIAANIVGQSIGQPLPSTTLKPEKNPAAVALGRLGGLKGGKARAKILSPEDRARIAQIAAKKRWAKPKG